MEHDQRRIEALICRMSGRVRFCVSGDARAVVLEAMWLMLDNLRTPKRPVFTIDAWLPSDKGIAEQIATAGNITVARAAYEAAVQELPGRPITLRNGIRVVRSTEKDRERKEMEG